MQKRIVILLTIGLLITVTTVNDKVDSSPNILSVDISGSEVSFDEFIDLKISVTNDGPTRDEGDIVIGFPDFDSIDDFTVNIVHHDTEDIKITENGDEIYGHYSGTLLTAKYPEYTFFSTPWDAYEEKSVELKILTSIIGTFRVYVKFTIGDYEEKWEGDPSSDGTDSMVIDQHNEFSYEYVFEVGPSNDAIKKEMSQRFSPILYFHQYESYYPIPVEQVIDNSVIKNFDGTMELDASELGFILMNSTDHFLDIDQEAVEELELENRIYSNVIFLETGFVMVQYWFFYLDSETVYFHHEGDWEMIEILLNNDHEPITAGYSQHYTGRKEYWAEVEKEGEHPIVYVAKGSHASYFDNGYEGDHPFEWSGCIPSNLIPETGFDITGNHLSMRSISDYDIEPLEDQYWLNWSGHWGKNKSIDLLDGPQGPKYRHCSCGKYMWNQSKEWLDHLERHNIDTKAESEEVELGHPFSFFFTSLSMVFGAFYLVGRFNSRMRKFPDIRDAYKN